MSLNKVLLQTAYFDHKFAIIFQLMTSINFKILSNFWFKIFNFRKKPYLATSLIDLFRYKLYKDIINRSVNMKKITQEQ